MKKTLTKLFIGLASLSLLLTACNNNPTPDPVDPSDPSDPTDPVDPVDPVDPTPDTYKVIVVAHEAVTYSVNKNEAEAGEEVILTISNVANGFYISEVTLNTSTTLAPENDGVTYKFNMPRRSATITIKVGVSGNITIQGDVAAVLSETEEGSGLYVARNVRVESSSSAKKFSFVVGDTKLSPLALDARKSFGNYPLTYGDEYAFSIPGGASYDFYYDSNIEDKPCYIKRVAVNDLPNNAEALADILVDGYTVGSEPAMYIDNLVGINYTHRVNDGDNSFNQKYEWKKYSETLTFATIEDLMADEEDANKYQYVYRSYDETNKVYTVVDTYSKYVGESKANDDYFRASYNNNTAYSARYSVFNGSSDDAGRFSKEERDVYAELTAPSHNPAYLSDGDIGRSYRWGVSSDSNDEISYGNVSVTSETLGSGFKTLIRTTVEYNSNEGTYTSDHHEGVVFEGDLEFDGRGALLKMTYKKTSYNKDQWNFTTHKPATGQSGTIKERISSTYTYGDYASGTPSFDVTPYFISSLDEIKFFNSQTSGNLDNDESYLGLKESIYLHDGTGEPSSNLARLSYSPSTALDLWEYGPTKSDNDAVISHLATDLYYQMTTVSKGSANVTFTNHLTGAGAGASKTIKVNVEPTVKIRGFYIQYTWEENRDGTYTDVDTSSSATVHANGQYKFAIRVSPSNAETLYHATSSNSDVLVVTSADNSKDLIIDTTPGKDITSTVKVNVVIHFEENADPSFSSTGTTILTFNVLPATASPVGLWKVVDEPNYPNTSMRFTTEAYSGSGAPSGAKKGYIIDEYFQNGISQGVDTYYFWYTYNGAFINAKVYDVDMGTGYSVTISDLVLDIAYDVETARLLIFLAESDYDSYYEDTVYYPLIGTTDDTGTAITSYIPFTKQ